MESLRPRVISEQNLIPKYLDSAYPMTWLITNAVFNSICVPSRERPSKWAAENGLRNAYIQKYVEKDVPMAKITRTHEGALDNQRVNRPRSLTAITQVSGQ
ncbi:hypothetical protein OAK04_01975 [Verrucomicrobia bacterium]|nr:hypothetical protein [Verrucomicrobiota bacterium]